MSDSGSEPRYPEVVVRLTAGGGNAYVNIGLVRGAIQRVRGSAAADEFAYEANQRTSWSDLERFIRQTVTVEGWYS